MAAKEGWYRDPVAERWWDGVNWTSLTRTVGETRSDGPIAVENIAQPAAWLPDPLTERYWDGSQWTAETRSKSSSATPKLHDQGQSATSESVLPPPPQPNTQVVSPARGRGKVQRLIPVFGLFALVVVAVLLALNTFGRDESRGGNPTEPPNEGSVLESNPSPTSPAGSDQQLVEGSTTSINSGIAPPLGRSANDQSLPAITSVNVDQTQVGSGDAFVLSTWVADPEGIESVRFIVGTEGITASMCSGKALLVTGNISSGNWKQTCRVPDLVMATGEFEISVVAVDINGNERNSLPVAAAIYVSGPASEGMDTTPPVIKGLSVSPSTLRPGDTFTISVQVEDPSGVSEAGFGIVKAGVNTYTGLCDRSPLSQSGGDSTNGTWSRTCQVPLDYTNFGDHVAYGTAIDVFGNSVLWQGSNIRAFFTVIP